MNKIDIEKWKKILKNPVTILAICCVIAGILLMVFQLQDGRKETVAEDRNTLTVSCPRLSEAADAFLLNYKGSAVLIDTGVKDDGKTILKLLADNRISCLEALILTHFDKDHIGSAAEILRNVRVKKCYMPHGSKDSEEYEALLTALDECNVENVVVTDTLTFHKSDVNYTIYPPLTDEYKKDQDNNNSLMIKVIYHGRTALFAGDAEEERMKEFLKSQYDGTAYELVKIPHHGRDKAVVDQLLELCSPGFAVITSSAEEPEEQKVVDALKAKKAKVLLTRTGDIYLKMNENGINAMQ